MKNIIVLLIASWIFLPSKTNKPTAPRRVLRQAETYTNRGYRLSRSTILVGPVQDNTFLYESWSQKHE